jgi:hypothetical protein
MYNLLSSGYSCGYRNSHRDVEKGEVPLLQVVAEQQLLIGRYQPSVLQ